jgi:hypothetical protein
VLIRRRESPIDPNRLEWFNLGRRWLHLGRSASTGNVNRILVDDRRNHGCGLLLRLRRRDDRWSKPSGDVSDVVVTDRNYRRSRFLWSRHWMG